MTKIIAWYLPQFHRVEENDKWWGEGFTEWNNLRDWKPVFSGHRIRRPHRDIGEYDILDVNVRRKQAEMAKKYGVYGFCYYHYWSNGKKLLEKPLESMLLDGQPDIPFCFSWANGSWERTWHRGLKDEKDILWTQEYGGEVEWEQHFCYMLSFFRHENYIKINDKPMFLVYRLELIPDYEKRFQYWDRRLKEEGFSGLHLVGTLRDYSVKPQNVNAVVEFPPVGYPYRTKPNLVERLRFRIVKKSPKKLLSIYRKIKAKVLPRPEGISLGGIAEYNKILGIPKLHTTHYRSLFAGWDHSPRTGKMARIYQNISPEVFARALQIQTQRTSEFLFINAWNEWGEGAVLEPDDIFGYAYLEAIAKISKS